ncbi:histidine phosphatase family protein [Nocardioides KLBMP 9356]|uniref:phosphoglycerate mutase (2,3-diphosphoglycerate-dependent) n=1 Tax=Nocardioides potassii TaxID=2911371 RepID=A0ABS9HBA2_9ACTN|nr:histidine phosphatase family protein [Nocardioides potassii]MCF6377525.1 histidine phosphatase family protein [Nocardioides potassii]
MTHHDPLKQLVLVRHGQSEGNVAAEAAARDRLERIEVPARDPDVVLSGTGRDQAAAVGRWLAALAPEERPEVLWTSPYRRARETAEIALDTAGLDIPRRVDERLRDRDMGITDKLTSAGIRAAYPEEAERRDWLGKFYYRPPGGESWADVAMRVRAVLTDLAHAEKHQRVLVTGHDVVLLLFCYVAEAMDEEQVLARARDNALGNAAICRLQQDPDSPTGWDVTDYNLRDHLQQENVSVTDEPSATGEA